MTDFNVLFLCIANSARSILAEAILRKDGRGRFSAFSAGTNPKGSVNPLALKVLDSYDYETEGFRSKSREEFVGPAAPEMDFIFTVSDTAAGEAPRYGRGIRRLRIGVSKTRQGSRARISKKRQPL